jgi:hypothetical protein
VRSTRLGATCRTSSRSATPSGEPIRTPTTTVDERGSRRCHATPINSVATISSRDAYLRSRRGETPSSSMKAVSSVACRRGKRPDRRDACQPSVSPASRR